MPEPAVASGAALHAGSAFTAALLVGLATVPLVRVAAQRMGAVDLPGDRRVHRQATPRLGGIAVVASALVAFLLVSGLGELGVLPEAETLVPLRGGILVGLLLLLVGLALVGAADDLRQLSARRKLLWTVAVATIAARAGLTLESLDLPGLGVVPLGLAALPVTVLWITSVTHALNLVDGVDGLAGSIALVAIAGTGVSFALDGAIGPLLLSACLAGALVAFLRANWHPASIFLGDAGALALGGVAAALVALHTDEGGTRLQLGAADLLLVAYPLADTTVACLRRYLRGVPVSSADRNHVHHRLLATGLVQPLPALMIGCWAAGMGAIGLAVRHADRPGAHALLLGGAIVVGALLLHVLGRLHYVEFEAFVAGVQRVARFALATTRERIHLREGAARLAQAASLEEAGTVLGDTARQVRLVHAELTRSSARRRLPEGAPEMLWQVDWPLMAVDEPADDPLVLRIYGTADGPRPQSAGRFAEEFQGAIERWLTLPRRQELRRQRPGRRGGDGAGRATDREGMRAVAVGAEQGGVAVAAAGGG